MRKPESFLKANPPQKRKLKSGRKFSMSEPKLANIGASQNNTFKDVTVLHDYGTNHQKQFRY